MIKWKCKEFQELSPFELYEVLQLRIEVFMLEQECLYPECDDKDLKGYHLLGYKDKKLVAYLRVLPPGVSYDEVSLGRVVVGMKYRKEGLGTQLINKGISEAEKIYNTDTIRISAQNHLRNFYGEVGFVPCSEIYLEDNIPHVEMVRSRVLVDR